MFKVGKEYTKKDIYRILDVPIANQKGSWNTGYVKYLGCIYLFVNIGNPGRTGHDYHNRWDDKKLIWYGKNGTHKDQHLIKEMTGNLTKVRLFTREEDRAPFKYRGIGKAIDSDDSSPVCITWRIIKDALEEKPHYIDPLVAWDIFLKNINEAYLQNMTFTSPIKQYEYSIADVSSDKIHINRLTAAQNRKKKREVKPVAITSKTFNNVIERFNLSNGVCAKTKLKGTVTIEAAIVWFLPMLDWDETQSNIIFDSIYSIADVNPVNMSIAEAKNDDLITSVTFIKRLRRGQNKLRKILIEKYSGKCCISECNVVEVLNACHIEAHKVNGNNNSKNALLLRSDIHDLWDMNLIGINPYDYTVHIKEELKETEYSLLENKILLDRTDGERPDPIVLEERWHNFHKEK